MKKFAWMIAALSLCACTFTACGGDDDKDDKGSGKAAIGAACEANDDCDSGYCGDDKTCADKPAGGEDKKDNDADCAKDDDCKSGYCDADSKKCADKPAGGEDKKDNDADCAKDDDCKSGYCDADSKKCADKPAGGEDKKDNDADCAKDDDCKSGYCDADSKKCADKPAGEDKKDNDADCAKDDDCKSGYCDADSKKCADKPAGEDKKDNDADCAKDDDCKSGYCDADSKKCADKPAGGEEAKCDKDADCEGNKDGKFLCNTTAGVCVDCLADNKVDDACDGSKPGPVCISNVCSKCTDDAQCGDGVKCDKESGKCGGGNVECTLHSDCKDASKPICSKNVCVAAEDPCKDVKCDKGSCDRGICVTDEMKKYKADGTETCNDAEFQSFCNGDKNIVCSNGKIVADDCAADKIGSCTAAENFGNYVAFCSNDEKAVELCNKNESSSKPSATINVCYGAQDWIAKSMCVTDVFGKIAAMATDVAEDCKGKACAYDGDKPACAK